MKPLIIFKKLLSHFGRQYWWPAKTHFEVIIGAFLTQQTNWKNAQQAIENLEVKGLLEPHYLATAQHNYVEVLIRQSGFYKQKAKRIISFSQYLVARHEGSLTKLFSRPKEQIRKELLSLKGIGPETADAILLYSANKLSFPIDTYTIRLCERLGFKRLHYNELKEFFESNLPGDLETYKEFHALIDMLGKTFCKIKPICSVCPLRNECNFPKRIKIKIQNSVN
jgi:endonuclease-3 related protein